jgi:hypothetical protein
LIVTTPYHGYFKNIAICAFGKWDIHHAVHWDGGHVKFFSRQTLRDLLINNGFSSLEWRGAGRVPFLWNSMVCSAAKS